MSKNKKGKKYLQEESINQNYKLLNEIGEGGNATVFRASDNSTGAVVAIKRLSPDSRTTEKEDRFRSEILIMNNNADVKGVMPITYADSENCWYVMPEATLLMTWSERLLSSCPVKQLVIGEPIDTEKWITSVVDCFIELAETLTVLHALGIHHRDIKPGNIYYLDGAFILGDFGLVEFPDNDNNHTRDDKGLGAIFTIAPEMKRNPKNADGAKADVYSLSKTLWMVLSGDEKGFDGQYSWNDSSHGLRYYKRLANEYLVEIEDLLMKCTSNSPDKRPDISQFKQELYEWKDSYSSQKIRDKKEWEFISHRIFGNNVPVRTVYNNPQTIVRVLNTLCQSRAMNHLFFPGGGGLDLTEAAIAPEQGFIYFMNGSIINIIKPRTLYFESFPDSRWNYFMLEAEEIDPIKGVSIGRHGDQCLVEDMPGHYVDASAAQYGVYDYDSGKPLPKGSKVVYRYLKGKFLIVIKTCGYNHIQSTYDGRHSDMTNEEFREYINALQSLALKATAEGYDENTVLNLPEVCAHPYPQRTQDWLFDEKDKEILPSAEPFFKSNFQTWTFKENILPERGAGKLAYRFLLEPEPFHSIFDKPAIWYLSKNGSVKELKDDSADIYEVFNRDLAINILESLNNSILERCSGYDTSSIKLNCQFDVKWRRMAMPNYMFSEEDIKAVMTNADDRNSNQLVIDEDGHPQVIVIDGHNHGSLYPVSHEIWSSGNNYVGKYSPLKTLHDDYADSLIGWLDYLRTGKRQYIDLNHYPSNLDDIRRQIATYYDNPGLVFNQ